MDQTTMDRFFSRVDRGAPHECWLWTASVSPSGHGRFNDHGHIYAHRFIFQAVNGPIPAGMSVDHVCYQPACVNPVHMRLLPPEVNTAYRRKALARRCPRGHNFYIKASGKRLCGPCNVRRGTERRRERRALARG